MGNDMKQVIQKSKPKQSLIVLLASVLLLSISSAITAPAHAAPVSVNWWTWNPNEVDAPQYISAFEKENPDIKIVHKFLQYTDYLNALRLAATSGEGPDVFGVQSGALVNQYAPVATDLSSLAQTALGSNWKKQMTASSQLNIGGKQIAMPWMITGAGFMWYNKTILDASNLTVPKDFASFKKACAVLAKKKINCFEHGAKDAWVNLDLFQSISNQIAPGEFYKAIVGKSTFNSPKFIKAFDAWKSLFSTGIIQKGALAQPQYMDTYDNFTKGKAAFTFLGTWNNSNMTHSGIKNAVKTYGVKAIAQFEFLPASLPSLVPNAKKSGFATAPDVGWVLNSKSQVQDAAWKWIQFLTIGNGQKLMAATLQQPANSAVGIDTSDIISKNQLVALKWEGKQIAKSVGAREIPNADVSKALSDALSAVAAGTQTSAKAAKSVADAVKAAYK